MSNKSKKKKKEWVRTFEVSEAMKVKDHSVYQVTSWLFPMGFPEASTKLVTMKRYSEFQKLHKSLSQIHKNLYLSGTMPSLPKANFFNRFDSKILSERREKCLELLTFAASHPPLYNSQIFLNFFATTSPSSMSSNEEIGNLMDQGQIMEAAIASTQLVRDKTPTLEPIFDPEIVESEETLNNHGDTNNLDEVDQKIDKKFDDNVERDTPEENIVSKAINVENNPDTAVMPEYLNEAANLIMKASECESEERFDESVACYRKAIGTLLDSLPKDKCLKRQASVKRRIAQYIDKAENLSKMVEVNKLSHNNKGLFQHLDYFCDIHDLKRYKMQRILGTKVILATDTKENDIKVVIKVVQKTINSNQEMKLSVLPINVNYMAKLKRYYETPDTLILVLDYIAPGCLFRIVHPYLKEKSAKILNNSIKHSHSVFKTDPQLTKNQLDLLDNSSEEKIPSAEDDDMEFVYNLSDILKTIDPQDLEDNDEEEDDEEIESELLCINQAGGGSMMNTNTCWDDQNRFGMLDDHTNEIIAKRLSILDNVTHKSSSSNPNQLSVTPISTVLSINSAPISVPSTTSNLSPISHPPTPQSFKLSDIISTFGGQELQSCPTLPMSLLKSWTVQLVKVILDLHSKGIYVQDLNPSNVLLSENGQLTLTFQYQWISIENPLNPKALDQNYCAPEVNRLTSPTPKADWWSVGALLFELYTGFTLSSFFPSNCMQLHTPIPWNELDQEAFEENGDEIRDLLSGFLCPNPELRLTRSEDIKKHRFFRGIDWTN